MRTTSLYLALGIVPLAMCAPLPLVLVDTLEHAISRSGPQHPPAPVLSKRPPHALPRIINWGPDEDDANFETVIDNRPITPSADADPSVVLQAPRPIVTDYLMTLSVKKDGEQVPKVANDEQQNQRILVLPVTSNPAPSTTKTEQIEGDEDSISVAEMDIILPVFSQGMKMATTPCEHAKYLSREQSDIIIICLAVVFLFAVVILETVASFSQRRREGAIKLEDEKAAAEQSNSRTLSIQADEQ